MNLELAQEVANIVYYNFVREMPEEPKVEIISRQDVESPTIQGMANSTTGNIYLCEENGGMTIDILLHELAHLFEDPDDHGPMWKEKHSEVKRFIYDGEYLWN